MLNIFVTESDILNTIDRKKDIRNNDVVFNGLKDRISQVDDTMKKIIFEIDGSKYISGTTIKTRFGEYLDMKYLSTGCKTALNVYLNPDRLVYCVEAGSNALEIIFEMSRGNILVPIAPSIMKNFLLDATLFMNGKRKGFTNSDDLMEAWVNG